MSWDTPIARYTVVSAIEWVIMYSWTHCGTAEEQQQVSFKTRHRDTAQMDFSCAHISKGVFQQDKIFKTTKQKKCVIFKCKARALPGLVLFSYVGYCLSILGI